MDFSKEVLQAPKDQIFRKVKKNCSCPMAILNPLELLRTYSLAMRYLYEDVDGLVITKEEVLSVEHEILKRLI